jgi:hypothetical protein|mmetsp:Transcript_24392/g.44111  ORF Transcript_24392/g.44111 Transcript_24392/m.44111 type:complete len:87 (+) Transcript_24392:58-318(+)
MGKKKHVALQRGDGVPAVSDAMSEFLISSEVDDYDEERRFLWHYGNAKVVDATTQAGRIGNAGRSGMTGKFSKHQVNYGATKYIKP